MPLETDLLNTNRNTLVALGLLTLDIFGTSTVVGGLPCTPTSPGTLNVQVGPGRIYSLEAVDSTAYSSLAADTVDDIVKQGINLATTTLSCPAPTTAGDSIDYLIEAIYEDQDAVDVVLPYYDSSNPGNPYSGPGGNNQVQATVRQGVCSLKVKAGVPAATGTQSAPPADSGYTALYIVTVDYGETAITAADISVYPGAPFITGALLSEPVADARYLKLIGGVLTGPLTGTSGIFTSLTVNGTSVQNAAVLTSGLVNAAQLGTGSATNGVFLRGDSAWSQVSFANLGGSIANGQVPVGAVTQWQGSLSIGGSQVSGPVAQANTLRINGYATFNWAGQGGQPTYVFGSNDGTNVYVWNPANFNVGSVQGYAPTAAAAGNTLAVRDGSGYLWANYFNQASGQNENPSVSQVIVTNNSDNFLRKAGLGYFINQLDPGASMAPSGYQRLPNGKMLQWATVGLGDIPANGTLLGTAYFPFAFPNAIEGWASDSRDTYGNNLGSYVWNTLTVTNSYAQFGCHEIINVQQYVNFRIFAIGW